MTPRAIKGIKLNKEGITKWFGKKTKDVMSKLKNNKK